MRWPAELFPAEERFSPIFLGYLNSVPILRCLAKESSIPLGPALDPFYGPSVTVLSLMAASVVLARPRNIKETTFGTFLGLGVSAVPEYPDPGFKCIVVNIATEVAGRSTAERTRTAMGSNPFPAGFSQFVQVLHGIHAEITGDSWSISLGSNLF